MANRAYLYAGDRADTWERPDGRYFDSRWTIPLSWFFFYQPDDIRMVDVPGNGADWQEVKFSAEKRSALELFAAREPLLLSLVEGRIRPDAIAKFMATIERFPGRLLLLDAAEVLAGMSAGNLVHAERFGRILILLASGEASCEAIQEAVRFYVGRFDPSPDRCLGQVIGYTY